MSKPELQQQLQTAIPTLTDDDFYYHETDLYVLNKAGVNDWLRANYKFYSNIQRFVGATGSPWAGLQCLDIPFAGKWEKS